METRDDPEVGPVRTCLLCREEWPDDDEFYRDEYYLCRACEWELGERVREQTRRRVARLRASRREAVPA